MGLETQLRESLRSRAGQAPPGHDLLDGVRRHRTRLRRRRWSTLTAGFAAVVMAAVTIPSLVSTPSDPTGYVPPPTLVEADLDIPYFPYGFTWLPPGLAEVWSIGYGPHGAVAFGVNATGRAEITVGPEPFPVDWSGDESQTTVGWRPATLRTGRDDGFGSWVMLAWAQGEQWITVHLLGGFSPQDARRIGEGLVPGRMDIHTRIRLRLAPDGWVVGSVDENWRELRRTSPLPRPEETGSARFGLCLTHPTTAHDLYRFLCVEMSGHMAQPMADPEARKVVVGGGEGYLVPGGAAGAGPSLYFVMEGLQVIISHGYGPRLSDEDLIRFAEGIYLED